MCGCELCGGVILPCVLLPALLSIIKAFMLFIGMIRRSF